MGNPIQLCHIPRGIGLDRVAVLASGGLDSSILLTELSRGSEVFPIYVKAGLAWEEQERQALERFLAYLKGHNINPVTTLEVTMRPIYGEHWSVTGDDVPGAGTDDQEVFLPGRNVILLGLAAAWCSTHGVHSIAIGSLGSNPFPDATQNFFDDFAKVIGQGLAHEIRIIAPYLGFHKQDLIGKNSHLPLGLTLTCMAPKLGVHCGACNKCHERRLAFRTAGVADGTIYDVVSGGV